MKMADVKIVLFQDVHVSGDFDDSDRVRMMLLIIPKPQHTIINNDNNQTGSLG